MVNENIQYERKRKRKKRKREKYFLLFLSLCASSSSSFSFGQMPTGRKRDTHRERSTKKRKGDELPFPSNTQSQLILLKTTEEIIIVAQ